MPLKATDYGGQHSLDKNLTPVFWARFCCCRNWIMIKCTDITSGCMGRRRLAFSQWMASVRWSATSTRCDTMVCQPVNNLVDQAGWCIGEMGRVGKEDIVDMLSALWPWNAILCFFFKSFTEIPRCKLPVQWCPQALYNGGGGLWPHTTMLFIFSLTSRDSWQQPQGLIKVTAAKCIRTQDDYQHIMFFIDAPCSLSCAQYPFRNVCVSL